MSHLAESSDGARAIKYMSSETRLKSMRNFQVEFTDHNNLPYFLIIS